MSYSVYLKHVKNARYGEFTANITSNLTSMFIALPSGDISEWNNKRAKELIEPIKKSIQALRSNPQAYRKYESPNGWGTVKGTIYFLEKCLLSFMLDEDAIIQIED